jgi:hypothetical protein
MVQLRWDSIWNYICLLLKGLEIPRKIMYYLKYDKIGLAPLCFSGSDMWVGFPIYFTKLHP